MFILFIIIICDVCKDFIDSSFLFFFINLIYDNNSVSFVGETDLSNLIAN